MNHSHPERLNRPTEAERITQGCGPTLLMKTELDGITGAGSKPGATGEGKSAFRVVLSAR